MNLLDFGIAIPESQSNIDMETHDFCLTPMYIPPEIAKAAAKFGEEDSDDEEEEILDTTPKVNPKTSDNYKKLTTNFT